MKKQTVMVIVTTVITTLILIAAFIYFIPIIGPRYLHPMMMGGSAPTTR